MKKLLIFLMALLFMGTAIAQTNAPWHSVQIVDETGAVVTSITSVEIYAPNTTTNAVIFADRGLNQTMVVPITESSTNTTLIDGVLSWYGPDGYDFSITDGTNIATNANHRTRTASEGTLVFPSYITAISSTTYADGATATFGTSADWVAEAGTVSDRMTWTPATANTSQFYIGNASFPADLNLWGTLAPILWDASESTLEILDSAKLAIGTGDDFTISHVPNTTTFTGDYVTSGSIIHSADVRFDGAADVFWDDSENTMVALDNAVFGWGNSGAAPDIETTWDTDSFNLTAAAADTPWEIGATAAGFDITYFFETAGNIFTDYDGDFCTFTDDMELRFGTGGGTLDGDLKLSSNSSNVLQLEQVVLDTGTFEIGVTDRDIPTKWWAETAGDFVLFTGDLVQFEDVSLQIMDDTTLIFGDGSDVTMQYDEDGGDDLQITGAVSFDNTVEFAGGQTRTVFPAIVLDGTVPPSQTAVGTSGQSQIPVYSFDANPNATGDDYVFLLWTVPAGYVVDSADLFFNFSYSTAETDGDDVVFDITVLALTPGSGAAGGTAFDAAGTAVGALDVDLVNGDGDEGKIMQGTFDIEVTALAVGDDVLIAFWVDEDQCDLDASGTVDIHDFIITYESTE